MSRISRDIECLKYVFSHGFSIGGSTERLARIIRIEVIFSLILFILIFIFMGK